jgi:hypothetical protein
MNLMASIGNRSITFFIPLVQEFTCLDLESLSWIIHKRCDYVRVLFWSTDSNMLVGLVV